MQRPETVQFFWPSDLNTFEEASEIQYGITHLSFNSSINQEDIKVFAKEEILETYKQIAKNEDRAGYVLPRLLASVFCERVII